ncbi:MAG: TMEM175 family protein [Ferruginibacter sp.]
MLRKKFAEKKNHDKDSIAWRGHEVTRIEAFSDAVFAFALTLLIVALEVPHDYNALMECMTFFVPFAICFTMLFTIWYAQNMFFRRFGLHDFSTLILNGIMLFLVLFFVYPLKFLFSAMFSEHFHITSTEQLANLFYIYSGAVACIYILLGLMYYNAIRKKESLELTSLETFEAKSHMLSYLLIALVAIFSMLLAFLGKGFINFAGIVYFLIGPIVTILYSVRGKKKKILLKAMAEPEQLNDNGGETEINKVQDDTL